MKHHSPKEKNRTSNSNSFSNKKDKGERSKSDLSNPLIVSSIIEKFNQRKSSIKSSDYKVGEEVKIEDE